MRLYNSSNSRLACHANRFSATSCEPGSRNHLPMLHARLGGGGWLAASGLAATDGLVGTCGISAVGEVCPRLLVDMSRGSLTDLSPTIYSLPLLRASDNIRHRILSAQIGS